MKYEDKKYSRLEEELMWRIYWRYKGPMMLAEEEGRKKCYKPTNERELAIYELCDQRFKTQKFTFISSKEKQTQREIEYREFINKFNTH